MIALAAASAPAQVSVRLHLERDKFLIYEPIVATVHVENYGINTLKLTDEESQPWLRFEILRRSGQRVSMVGPGFLAGSTTVGGGRAVGKTADLVSFYNVRELGGYRVRAMVKVAGIGGAFASNELTFDVIGGRVLWSKPVGVAGAQGKESLRTYSLLTMRLEPYNRLYARVESEREGLIYGVVPLGPWVTLSLPRAEVDKENLLHVLHQIAPRNYSYTRIAPNGAVLKRDNYSNFTSTPELQRDSDRVVKVVGGEIIAAGPAQGR